MLVIHGQLIHTPNSIKSLLPVSNQTHWRTFPSSPTCGSKHESCRCAEASRRGHLCRGNASRHVLLEKCVIQNFANSLIAGNNKPPLNHKRKSNKHSTPYRLRLGAPPLGLHRAFGSFFHRALVLELLHPVVRLLRRLKPVRCLSFFLGHQHLGVLRVAHKKCLHIDMTRNCWMGSQINQSHN